MNISCGLSEVCRPLSLLSSHACQVLLLVVVHSWILTVRCGRASAIRHGKFRRVGTVVFSAFLSLTGLGLCMCISVKRCEVKDWKTVWENLRYRKWVYSESGYLLWIFNLAYQFISLLIDSCLVCRYKIVKPSELDTGCNFSYCCILVSLYLLPHRQWKYWQHIFILMTVNITRGNHLEAKIPKCRSCM